MANEFEIVRHPRINNMNMFIVAMEYRTPHLHRDFELHLILEGHLTLLSTNKRFTANAGDLLLLNPNQPHELFTQGEVGATILCLQISPRFFKDSFPSMPDIFFEKVILRDDKATNWLKKYIIKFVELATAYNERQSHYQLFCALKINEIFLMLLEHVPYHLLSAADQQAIQRKVERINRLIDFVDTNYMHKANLKTFADSEGLSLNHMSYFIKENLNQTFQEYVTNVRYNQARNLLLTQNKRLIDICLESGFSDIRYLNKAFLQKTGMRPDEFRRKFAVREEDHYYRSLHSSQKFYTDEESVRILKYVRDCLQN